MDTAPKDGSEIMAWIPPTADGPGFHLKVAWTGDTGWQGTVPHSLSGYEPSHWMPLPEVTDDIAQP